ncbi:MAG: cation-translocating P-type ATPase, partial [Bacteroidia bacterium]|nr:cation-translocating P-type ATPase [Bacteroidia bacterium]
MHKDIKTIRLNVEGMHCTNCALGVRRTLEKEGFSNVFADFASNEVKIDVEDQGKIDLAVKAIQSLGYTVSLDSDEVSEKKPGLSSIEKKFWFSAIFTVPLVLSMFLPIEFLHNDMFQLALTIPVFAVGFWHFGRSAFM